MSEPGAERDPIDAWLAATAGREEAGPPSPAGPAVSERRISRRLVVLTAIPWLVVVALGSAAVGNRDAASTPADTPSAAPSPPLATTASPDPTAPATTPASAPMPRNEAVAAAAIVAVRLGTGPDTYLDTAVVEDTAPSGAGTVVTVRSVLLDRSGSAWSAPREVRHHVVVGPVDGEIVALSPAWQVAAPGVVAPRWDWNRVDEPLLLDAATAAVRAAGYSQVTVTALRRSGELPGVASALVDAVAPGARGRAAHELWLAADASSVLGTSAAEPDLPVPAEQP